MIRSRYKLLGICVLLGLATAGCQQQEISYEIRDITVTTENMVDVRQLAAELSMNVIETTPTYVKLQNSSHSVMIFTYTKGPFFVNGKSAGEVGTVEKKYGQFFVSESLTSKIRQVLGQAPQDRYPGSLYGRVVLDAGHGGKDPGAIGVNGYHEKTVNLQIAKKAAYLLRRRGLDVVMTRGDDTFVELNHRADIANRSRPDLFVSIHSDSCLNRSVRGFTVYIATSASADSHTAAESIENAMRRTGLNSLGVKKADYRVLVRTECPAVLVEMGYLSNYREAALLVDDGFQNQVAGAIVNGICQAVK